MSQDLQAPTPDAIPHGWVDGAPRAVQPWLRLARLDRPIGTWLLFLPCVFGLALGIAGDSQTIAPAQRLWLLALFAVGSLVMRGAGCTYNDIVDRDIDAAVARTRGRPIPSGAASVTGAWIFLGLQCAIGLAVLLQLNLYSVALGAASLVLIAIYPFMKRVTWWPQAWLGLTFNWGALVGYAAVTGRLALPATLLYAGCFFWTLGYDTIYAHQDKDDDALIGVKSTARLFGEGSRRWIAAFYVAAAALIGAAAFEAGLGLLVLVLLAPAAAHLAWQVLSLRVNDPENCLKVFRANRDTGLLIAAALVVACYRG
ncbi:MAG: 4-hydroxybenzoate octaprenyltransferase [Rhizomicrobium sp.]|jgi:4-hydroxybenzoate polyprenyltransferase